MEVSTNLSKNLRRIIKEKGMTQLDLAAKMGAKPTTVNSWFRGANAPRFDTLENLADVLDVSINDLTADYNSTIPRNNREFVKTPIASGVTGVQKPKVIVEGSDGFLGKSKTFWRIVELADNMTETQQRDVLAMLNIMSRK